MSYKNKTYVILDYDNDKNHFNTMKMWKENDKIDFDFYDAHNINNLRDDSSEQTIKTKLRERMKNTKQVIVLIGDATKFHYKYVKWEIELALELDLPVIAVNIDKKDGSTKKTPPVLVKNAYFVSVPFEMKKIRYALDNFPADYVKNKGQTPKSFYYIWDKINLDKAA